MSDHSTSLLEKNVWKLMAQKSLVTAYFQLPIIVLFWQDAGLSMLQIMTLQAVFSISTVLLELPSGIFADLYGRKLTLILAAILDTIGIAVYCTADTFYEFLFAELFLAGFVALQSGADTAFLYDTLKALKRTSEYPKILGNVIFFSTMVLAATNVIGGFIGDYNLRWTLFACLPFVFSACFVSLSLTEPPKSGPTSKLPPSIRNQLASIRQVIVGDKSLLWIIIYAGIILTFNQAGLWLYQPYFELTGISVFMFGVIFASFQFVAAFAGKWYHHAKERFGERVLLISLVFISTGASLLLGQLIFTLSFTFIFLHQVVRGFYKIIFSDLINQRVESDVRASVLSVQNLVGRILTALIMPFIGFYADVYSIQETFTLIGVIGIVSGLPVLWFLKRYGVI
jgi:MFS family permease